MSREMICGEHYFNIYRIMFTILGLWPYQKARILRIQAVFFFSVYLSFLVFQLTTFATTACDMECLIKKLSYICITVVYILNYYSFFFNAKTIKQSFEHMQSDWKMLENDNAMKILEKYVYNAYIFTLFILILIGLVIIFFITYECIPVLFDVLLPLNESRLRKTEIEFELFLDDQQYFFVYAIQEFLGLTLGLSSIIVTGTYLLVTANHACAIYKIAGNLMRGTVTKHVLNMPAPQRMYFMYKNIRHSIQIYKRNVKLVNEVVLSLEFWYFPLVIIGVVSLSCVLFRLFNAVNQFNDYIELFIAFMLFYVHFMYMLMVNFYGQLIIDHSVEIWEATYNTLWYLAPIQIQKLLLFMLSSIKDQKLKIAGFFILSVEGFSTLLTTAISYFTVIHAMHS